MRFRIPECKLAEGPVDYSGMTSRMASVKVEKAQANHWRKVAVLHQLD